MKYALAPQTPIPESDICPIGLGRSTNVLQVIYPDSRTGNEPNRPGNCSYSYQLKPCREIWGEKLCTQANDRYGRRPGSLHIVIGIVFNTSVDGNSLRPGPGKQGTVTVISCCVPGGPYVDIDIRPDMTHPNFIYNIVSLKPYTSPDVLGVCRAHFFGLLLIGNPDSPATSIRGSGGSVLDGNYDGVPGGTYQMRFLPPPC